MLWWPERQLLIVPEAVGTSRYFALGRPLGVHPLLRITPPFSLRCFKPRSILVGHGPSLHDDAGTALAEAVENARADIVQRADDAAASVQAQRPRSRRGAAGPPRLSSS